MLGSLTCYIDKIKYFTYHIHVFLKQNLATKFHLSQGRTQLNCTHPGGMDKCFFHTLSKM